MPAPTIFGVEGTSIDGRRTEWTFGPWRLVVVDKSTLRLGAGFAGMVNLAVDGVRFVGVRKFEGEEDSEVAGGLESWLRCTLAETIGALGLELRERDP